MASRLVSYLTTALLLSVASPAFATWSVIAVDQKTREVVIASATCVPQAAFAGFPAKGLMDVQAIVVPGKGVAAAQAGVDRTRKNQQLVFDEIVKGTEPAKIIELLKADPAIEMRQFAIVDLQGRTAGFSGQKNLAASLSQQRQVAGTGIFFSIQGNILAGDEVVTAAMTAFEEAKGSLTDRVMAAMEEADAQGGDKRCTCATPPQPAATAACETKTSHVAYILRADPVDKSGASFNDGTYAMYIAVTNDDIQPAENANPVRTLRLRYEAWQKAHPR
ncbi:MAG TPA: DUF1028 domain-containing protein [Vicinamibacterales bacterium]|nr:DUF1028 domain-containing protein [Vicinamibacterales bacterium]